MPLHSRPSEQGFEGSDPQLVDSDHFARVQLEVTRDLGKRTHKHGGNGLLQCHAVMQTSNHEAREGWRKRPLSIDAGSLTDV